MAKTRKLKRKKKSEVIHSATDFSAMGLRSLRELLPREVRALAGVGPTEPSRTVRGAMLLGEGVDHLGEPMASATSQVMAMVKLIVGAPAEYVVLCANGSATNGMEMALNGVVWLETRVLACVNGHFSERMAMLAERRGAEVDRLVAPPGEPITLEMVQAKLDGEQRYDVMTICHGETSTGVLNHETEEICCLAKSHGLITVMDGVCTVPCLSFPSMGGNGVDVLFLGPQKGIGAVAGANPVIWSTEAWARVKTRPRPCESFALDPVEAYKFWVLKSYHVTAPVQDIFALHQALWEILQEGLPQFQKRHVVASEALQRGLEAAGFELFIPAKWRLPTAIAVKFGEPDGDRGDSVRSQLRNRLKTAKRAGGVVIAGAFGKLPIMRIGCMANQAREDHLWRVLFALALIAKEFKDEPGCVKDPHCFKAIEAVRSVFRRAGEANPPRTPIRVGERKVEVRFPSDVTEQG